MSITIRFFASLREEIGDNKTLDSNQLAALSTNSRITTANIWNNFTDKELSENILISVNMEYVDASHTIKDGDEIAFFPPVTGG
jgi:molybdopterin synthase sulfur carrier subunit